MALTATTNTTANTAIRYLRQNDAAASSSLAKLSSGSRIVKSSDDAAGLAILDSVPIDAIVVDPAPRTPSAALVEALRARRPTVPILLCAAPDRSAPGPATVAYLPPPFQRDALDRALARLLPV